MVGFICFMDILDDMIHMIFETSEMKPEVTRSIQINWSIFFGLGTSFSILGASMLWNTNAAKPNGCGSEHPWLSYRKFIVKWWVLHIYCLVVSTPKPLWKIWVRQLGLLFPTIGENKTCSKPPTSCKFLLIVSSNPIDCPIKSGLSG